MVAKLERATGRNFIPLYPRAGLFTNGRRDQLRRSSRRR